MSSRPGLTLESFIEWNWDLVVMDDSPDANVSLRLAEMMGKIHLRPRITPEQFSPILALYEPYREHVEHNLAEFDDETQSWRDYAGYAFSIPKEVDDAARSLVHDLRQAAR
jgi:hypothetical protein